MGRCGLELSKTNLVELLDVDTVQNYENSLWIAYTNIYGSMARSNMINCIRCQQKKEILSMRMSSSKGKGMLLLCFNEVGKQIMISSLQTRNLNLKDYLLFYEYR